MKLTRGENCGLQGVRNAFCPTFGATQKLPLALQPSQWISSGQAENGNVLVSVLQLRGAEDSDRRPDNDGLRTDISTYASVSDNRDSCSTMAKTEVESVLSKVNDGLSRKVLPKKNDLATSGVYTMRDGRRNVVAIFKPANEEPSAKFASSDDGHVKRFHRALSCDVAKVNDSFGPRRHLHEKSRPAPRTGLFSGELCLREVAAFMLDSEGVHGVPATAMVQVSAEFIPGNNSAESEAFRMGSLQKFAQNNGVTSNISCSKFSVFEVQKIALLDLRILNSDRNEANILFRRFPNDEVTLIPIDHALSIPDKLEVYQSDLCWLDWPQSREPLSPELMALVNKIDPAKDAELIRTQLGIREDCIKNLRIAEIFLKKAVEKGLSLAKIASMMYRATEFTKSPLEKLVEKTRLSFDLILRHAEKLPIGVNLSPRSSAKDLKKGVFTPQKFLNQVSSKMRCDDSFDTNENRNSSRLNPLLLSKNPSLPPCPIPLNIFPQKSQTVGATVSPKSKFEIEKRCSEGSSPALKELIAKLPEFPDTFQLPRKDSDDWPSDARESDSVNSSPVEQMRFASNSAHPCSEQFNLLEAQSSYPSANKNKKIPKRVTLMSNNSAPVKKERSATQERKKNHEEDFRESFCFTNAVKSSQQSLTEVFFECFEANVSRFLDQKTKKAPRKYTMHAACRTHYE